MLSASEQSEFNFFVILGMLAGITFLLFVIIELLIEHSYDNQQPIIIVEKDVDGGEQRR